MSMYQYSAYNAAGKTIAGSQEADGLPQLEDTLRGLGLWLIEAKEGAHGAGHAQANDRTRVKQSDLIHFFVQMSLLLKAGITLPHALERLGTDNADSKLGEVVEGIREQVVVGVPLHVAMSRFPRVFSRQITAMIEAGEVSGRLPEVFENLSEYYEWVDGLTGDVRQALIYPLMVVGASLALIVLLFTLVVPRFVGLLTDLNLEVPTMTKIVMAISQLLVKGWPVLLALVFVVPFSLRMALKHEPAARWFDRNLMRIPIFGTLVGMFGLSRFSHNLAMLTRAGIPLLRGLEICEQLVGNRAIEFALTDVRRAILEGAPFNKALAKHDVFPPTLVTMIATGEGSGNLDFALQSVADYYNKLIPRRIKIVFAVFDPLMMLTLIGVVGTVALAVVLPILQLWQAK